MSDLAIHGLTVMRSGRPVLKDAEATLRGARRTVLWGPSGAGKSTLLAAIAGLLEPASGSIRIGEEALFSSAGLVSVAPHLRRIGFVFQDLALWPHIRALDQVRLVAAAAGENDGRARAKAAEALSAVGLGGLERRRPGELSGGEQQRLALARALAGRPEILLLDEPFSSVDGATRRTLRALLREISPRIPGPTLYVTHDPGDVQELAEDILELESGQLVPRASPEELGL